ncbi:hypothetical protein GTY54_38370 [Streptomyces sp. SID625]|nr:hypothetical protein [Streptomyces sp. SID625]MYR61826.1 hypothetical protein [Streptomyces sp. SID625]
MSRIAEVIVLAQDAGEVMEPLTRPDGTRTWRHRSVSSLQRTSAEFPLLAVNNLPEEDEAPFRIPLAAAGSFIVNLELGNTSFGDWSRGAGTDGVYRGQQY